MCCFADIFLLLPYKNRYKKRFFVVQSSANLFRNTRLKQNYVIYKLERYAKVGCANCYTNCYTDR